MDDYYKNKNSSLYTINIFLKSCSVLGLGLSKDLTEELINQAYNKHLTQHSNAVLKGIKSPFELEEKIQARDYLLYSVKSKA